MACFVYSPDKIATPSVSASFCILLMPRTTSKRVNAILSSAHPCREKIGSATRRRVLPYEASPKGVMDIVVLHAEENGAALKRCLHR